MEKQSAEKIPTTKKGEKKLILDVIHENHTTEHGQTFESWNHVLLHMGIHGFTHLIT